MLGLASAGLHANGFSLVRSLVGDGDVRCRPAARPHALLPRRCPASARAVRRPRARPRDRRRDSREPRTRSADGARRGHRPGAPGSVRLCSHGSMLRACPRRSNGGSSTSASATARSCLRPTRASRGCPSSGGSQAGIDGVVFARLRRARRPRLGLGHEPPGTDRRRASRRALSPRTWPASARSSGQRTPASRPPSSSSTPTRVARSAISPWPTGFRPTGSASSSAPATCTC